MTPATTHGTGPVNVRSCYWLKLVKVKRSRTRRPLLPQREHAPERKCARTTPQLHGRPRDDMSVAVSADRDCPARTRKTRRCSGAIRTRLALSRFLLMHPSCYLVCQRRTEDRSRLALPIVRRTICFAAPRSRDARSGWRALLPPANEPPATSASGLLKQRDPTAPMPRNQAIRTHAPHSAYRSGTAARRAPITPGSTRPALSSAQTKFWSFSRNAHNFATQRSSLSMAEKVPEPVRVHRDLGLPPRRAMTW